MSSKTILLSLMAIMALTMGNARGQHTGFTPVKDMAAFRQRFAAGSARITSITSTFRQEKILTALTEKIVSGGEFWFKRDSKVRIEYHTPFQYLMVMNGDKLMVRDGEKENKVNVRSNKLFQQINRIIVDCVQGSVLDSKEFSVTAFENETAYLLEMTPSGKGLRDFFSTIVLKVDRTDYAATMIEMNEPGGDRTIITFTDKKINAPVADALFSF